MMLPVPTREAEETISAPKDEIPLSFFGFSEITRIASLNIRPCMNLVRTVKYNPPANNRSGTNQGLYRMSLIASITLSSALNAEAIINPPITKIKIKKINNR